MTRRSFTDRVFAGVCGGLATSTKISAWTLRALFVVLSLASLGIFAVVYVLLWWLVPLESPLERRGGFPVILVLLLIIAAFATWFARQNGFLVTPNGESLYLPGAAFVLAVIFFMRQLL